MGFNKATGQSCYLPSRKFTLLMQGNSCLSAYYEYTLKKKKLCGTFDDALMECTFCFYTDDKMEAWNDLLSVSLCTYRGKAEPKNEEEEGVIPMEPE